MSASISSGVVVGGKRFTVAPSREMRNLVKFHMMSPSFSTLLLMDLNSVCEALAFKPLYSSVGACDFVSFHVFNFQVAANVVYAA